MCDSEQLKLRLGIIQRNSYPLRKTKEDTLKLNFRLQANFIDIKVRSRTLRETMRL